MTSVQNLRLHSVHCLLFPSWIIESPVADKSTYLQVPSPLCHGQPVCPEVLSSFRVGILSCLVRQASESLLCVWRPTYSLHPLPESSEAAEEFKWETRINYLAYRNRCRSYQDKHTPTGSLIDLFLELYVSSGIFFRWNILSLQHSNVEASVWTADMFINKND